MADSIQMENLQELINNMKVTDVPIYIKAAIECDDINSLKYCLQIDGSTYSHENAFIHACKSV